MWCERHAAVQISKGQCAGIPPVVNPITDLWSKTLHSNTIRELIWLYSIVANGLLTLIEFTFVLQ